MKRATLWIAMLAAFSPSSHATGDSLDELGLEDLVKTEVTSVSRKSQSLSDVAAAAFVISSEDIRRSGAQALPDVLRMAPGIEVAQIDNGRYAVTARGFNGRFANKLQVLIDGRSIYHPMFSGVLWELDPIPLEDIERIEIIRGAGAVMWGANAVNGVINIISKHSRNQTGGAANVTVGSQGYGNVYARIGQSLDEKTSFKLSVQGRYAEPSKQFDSRDDAEDRLKNGVVDFRFDRDLGAGSDLAIWANASRSSLGDLWQIKPENIGGSIALSPMSFMQRLHSETLVGRYRWLSDIGIESSLQLSGSRSGIEITDFIDESRTTFDLDYLGRYAIGTHDVQWGLGLRNSSDDVSATGSYLQIQNPSFIHRTSGIFVQDDWTLIPESLKLGLGMRWDKATRNDSSYSPHATLLWTPSQMDSVWLKYARAPRTAARAEQDVSILAGLTVQQTQFGNLPIVQYARPSGQGLNAEKAEGLELGYRKQFSNTVSADMTAYRYRYTKLRSGSQSGLIGCNNAFLFVPIPGMQVDPARCPGILSGQMVLLQEIQAVNGLAGWSTGLELAADWLVTPNWRLQLSYSWSKLNMDEGKDQISNADAEMTQRAKPRESASLRSQWNMTTSQQLDLWLRAMSSYERVNITDATPSASSEPNYVRIPGYVTLDLRYGYRINKDLEVAVIGRNLIGARRFEYLSDYIPTIANEIKPSVMFTTRWKF